MEESPKPAVVMCSLSSFEWNRLPHELRGDMIAESRAFDVRHGAVHFKFDRVDFRKFQVRIKEINGEFHLSILVS